MLSKYTNLHDIPLALAVWLVNDDYDYQPEENYISASTLLKPTRQLILSNRRPTNALPNAIPDLSDLAAKAMGTALHDSIEKAWVKNYARNLAILGYPQEVIKNIRINPEPEELTEGVIPIYFEQRAKRKIGKWIVGGKFDLVAEGIVHDNKSTTTFAWTNGGKDEDYSLQGSIYRWLNPDKITEDFIRINFIFTDWQRYRAKQSEDYPQAKTLCKEYPLLSIPETERWIANKLAEIDRYWNAEDSQIPECSDKELWRSERIFKYYSDPNKTTRATKDFKTDKVAAFHHLQVVKMGQGIVIESGGEPKRCGYCEAVGHCQQAKRYFE